MYRPLKNFSFFESLTDKQLKGVANRRKNIFVMWDLGAILCKNQAKWEMKNFDPLPPLKFCMQLDIVEKGGV